MQGTDEENLSGSGISSSSRDIKKDFFPPLGR
jgi:hypothetical protein